MAWEVHEKMDKRVLKGVRLTTSSLTLSRELFDKHFKGAKSVIFMFDVPNKRIALKGAFEEDARAFPLQNVNKEGSSPHLRAKSIVKRAGQVLGIKETAELEADWDEKNNILVLTKKKQ